jgi:NSS family neurotransmitter:Na+ symporter
VGAPRRSQHGLWSSRSLFVLALLGAIVGLGNVWKFPHMVGSNGGAAFLVVYLLCVGVLGLPLLIAEIMLGRRARCSAVGALGVLAEEEGRWRGWGVFGWLAVAAACLLLSTYSVVGGWSLAYVFRAASGLFASLDPHEASEVFRELIRDPERVLAWHTIFMGVTMIVVARGVRWGLEEAVRWFVPALLGLLVLLAGFAMTTGALAQTLNFLLTPDWSALTPRAVLLALGHAFFSLSLGAGVVMTYGAYLGQQVPILPAALTVVVADVVIGLLGGLTVFPIAFAGGPAAFSGPGLIFQTLPLAFGEMANGTWFGTLFFLMLVFAAWTSAIALLEPVVAHLVERGLERSVATTYAGTAIWAMGLLSLLSFNVLEHVRPLAGMEAFRTSTPFDLVNFLVGNVLLPLVGLGIALFVGWRMSAASSELELGGGRGYRLWLFTIRYITPIAMLAVLLSAIGFL